MSSLEKKGWTYTYTSTSKQQMSLQLLSDKFVRDLGFIKQDYEHCGIRVTLGDDTFILPITDPEHPNCQLGVFAGARTIKRLIRYGAICENSDRFHPVVSMIDEMLREMDVRDLTPFESEVDITFGNGNWDYTDEEGFVYTLSRRESGNAFITTYKRIRGQHVLPAAQYDAESHLHEIKEQRSFFSTVAKPISFEDAVKAFNL